MKNLGKIMSIGFWLGLAAFFIVGIGVANAQYTGKAPYVAQFGVSQQEIGSGAHWQVVNKDTNDMVFVAVDYYTDEVVAHIYISAGESYTFVDLPIGAYYYKFSNAGNYFKSDRRFRFEGCDSEIYMCDRTDRPYEWTVDVWVERSTSVVPNGKISKEEFFN